MSKIGKKSIILPKDTSINIEGDKVTITGPKGNKSLFISEKVFSAKVNEKNEFQILPKSQKADHKTQLLWGTYRSIINNAVIGVSAGHEKILELNGVGFRANLKGESLNLQIGFSHDVNFKIPKNLKITVEKQTTIKINLKYYEGDPVIKEIKRISKPGRRVYSRANSIPRVMNGLGLAILSTPKGVMSDTEARKNNLGGEIICRVF